MKDEPPRSADLPPGYDEEDPYTDVELAQLPAWWRRNVETFRSHGMRPYRPPRFVDGKFTPSVIGRLEAELGVDIGLRAIDPRVGDRWEVTVDEERVSTVGRRRDGNGYTLYEIDSARFEELVRAEVARSE